MGQWTGHQFVPAELRADSGIPADEADRLRAAYGFPVVKAGDWRVRGIVEVTEDTELPAPSQ